MHQSNEEEVRSISKRHAFGIKSDVSGCIHWLDESIIIYPVGRNVVIHNIQTNVQKFFLTLEKTESISAIALSPNKKYIAIAETGQRPQIQIIDTITQKASKVLYYPELGSDRFVALVFSADGRHLATQGGAPLWNLQYWAWERSKPLGHIQVTRDQNLQVLDQGSSDVVELVTHISINPRDPLHIVVSGNRLFRYYRFTDGALKPIPGGLGRAQNFTAHSWVSDDRIVVATESADLLLIQDGQLRCPLAAAPADNHAILAIIPTSVGFICSGEMGVISIFTMCDDKDIYRRTNSINIETKVGVDNNTEQASVRAFALTQSESMLAIATSNNQILGLSFNTECPSPNDAPVFKSICQPFHGGPIVGLSTCIRKCIVATSSTDRTVRIWNILDNVVEIIKVFQSEPGAIALHPSGLHLLVCFSDKVRFMNLYGDNIQEFKVFNVRSVTDVRFSHGGQYFSLTYANVIHVYSTATCDAAPIAQLRGHSQRVKSLQWSSITPVPTDTRLVSCSLDGVVVDWDMKDMRKEGYHIDKRFHYHSVVSDDKNIWVVGAPTSTMPDIRWKVKLCELSISNMSEDSTDYEFCDVFINNLVLSQKNQLLIGGCSDGSVKMMTFPLETGIKSPPILGHAGAVNKLVLSRDESMLFSAGEDGSFFIYDIKNEARASTRDIVYSEEILISKSDLSEKNSTAAHLRRLLEEFKTDIEGEEKREIHQYGTEIKECTENFKLASTANAERFAAAWNSKVEQERIHNNRKRELSDKHRASCDTLEKIKQSELKELDDHCRSLRATIDADRERFMYMLEQIDEKYERQRRENEEEYKEKIRVLELQYRQKQDNFSTVVDTQNEVRTQLEFETDAQIEATRIANEEKIKTLVTNYMHMKSERAIMKKNIALLQKEIENSNSEIHLLDTMKQTVARKIRSLNDPISQLNSDIEDRDLTIGEKEKKIHELKKRNQDLEKHKFVLDHRIRQLKSQIEPKQMEIMQEKSKIEKKDAELEQLQKRNLALRNSIDEMKKNIASKHVESNKILTKLKDLETYKSRVRTDIGELCQLVQDHGLLREGANRLYQTHVVNRNGQRCATLESDVKVELGTHITFLSKTVASLKKKVAIDGDRAKSDVSSVMTENLSLLKEVHELRREIRGIRMTLSSDVPPNSALHGSTVPQVNVAYKESILKEIEANKKEMHILRSKCEELEKTLNALNKPRPSSSKNLTPINLIE